MVRAEAFWSYVRLDDEAEGGRIAQLAKHIVAEYEMLTGDSIVLFLDREDIQWGDRWRDVVDGNLASIAFFIPVLTPRYFQSHECRRELQSFARRARELGVRELIIPLKYIEVSELNDTVPEDDLIALVKEFHWEDWTDLRFTEPESESYRRAIGRLAARLVEANQTVEVAVPVIPPKSGVDITTEHDEGEPGALDRMAAGEAAMPAWIENLEAITAEILNVNDIMVRGTEGIRRRDNRGAGFSGRLAVARSVADELTPVSERIVTLSNAFTTHLHSVDGAIRTTIEEMAREVAESNERKDKACEFFRTVRELSEKSQEGLGSLQGMIDAIQPIEQMSRDLRRPLRALRRGLTVMHEGRAITAEWLRLIEGSPIDCIVAV